NPMLKFLLSLSMGVFCFSPLQAGDVTPFTKSFQPGAKQAQFERWVTDIKKAVALAYKGDLVDGDGTMANGGQAEGNGPLRPVVAF
ncbi:hypothetical protein ACC690_38240, partial [Rhizobium johnstonii]